MWFSLQGVLVQVTDICAASYKIREWKMIALEFKNNWLKCSYQEAALLLERCLNDG